jgi:hypothetical protein
VPDIDRLTKWVEIGLNTNGHPPLADVVKDCRDKGIAWIPLAARIAAMSGESVSAEWLRLRFTQTADDAGARP